MIAANTPGSQKIWGWQMALSLFLSGAAAGAYLMGFILSVASGRTALLDVSVPGSAILAALGVILLVRHTTRKANFVRAFSHPHTSWMSRGAIALALFFILALLNVILWQTVGSYVSSAGQTVIGIVTSVVALFILAYTGMLLKSLKPIALWEPALLPVSFVVSGIASGMALLALGLGVSETAGRVVTAAVKTTLIACVCFIVVEALIVALYLWRRNGAGSALSVKMIVSGTFAALFWGGAVAIGFLVPLILSAYSLRASSAAGLIVIGVAGLVGNAILKYVIVAAGRPKALDVAGDQVPAPVAARMTVSHYLKHVNGAASVRGMKATSHVPKGSP